MNKGNEKKVLTTKDYIEGLRNISLYHPESTVRGIFAIKAFARNNNEQDILEATRNSWSSNTENILSSQSAKDQRMNIQGAVVRHLCTSKSFSEISNNSYFNQQVLEPIKKWDIYEGEVSSEEAESIMKERMELKQEISGVLWTLHKNELQTNGFEDSTSFANSLFNGEEGIIRPNDYSETSVIDIKNEITSNPM